MNIKDFAIECSRRSVERDYDMDAADLEALQKARSAVVIQQQREAAEREQEARDAAREMARDERLIQGRS